MGRMWRGTRGRTSVLAIAAALVLVCLLVSLPMRGMAQTKSEAKNLRIGYIVAMSGWYSVFDAVEDRYIKAMAKIINEKGGITVQGQKLQHRAGGTGPEEHDGRRDGRRDEAGFRR